MCIHNIYIHVVTNIIQTVAKHLSRMTGCKAQAQKRKRRKYQKKKKYEKLSVVYTLYSEGFHQTATDFLNITERQLCPCFRFVL